MFPSKVAPDCDACSRITLLSPETITPLEGAAAGTLMEGKSIWRLEEATAGKLVEMKSIMRVEGTALVDRRREERDRMTRRLLLNLKSIVSSLKRKYFKSRDNGRQGNSSCSIDNYVSGGVLLCTRKHIFHSKFGNFSVVDYWLSLDSA